MKDATQDPARQPGDPVRLQRITNGTAREHARYGSLSMIDRGRSGRGNAEFLPTLDYQFWQDSWAPSSFIHCGYLCGVMGLVFARNIRMECCSDTFGLDDDPFHPKIEP